MEFVVKPRRGGKTTEAIRWLLDTPGSVLLVMDENEVQRISREYPLIERRRLVTPDRLRRYLAGREVTSVGVDNLDMILWSLLGLGPNQVRMATWTDDEGVA